uniref:CoA-binding protein n=1 Tax=uncultured Draconibacterium sp. TaxID=1573823 RepID=UPI003216C252
MANKKTLVIGASENPARYSNKAIRALRMHNHEVVALAKREGSVDDVAIKTEFPTDEKIDTVTLYVGPQRQPEYYTAISRLKPKRVIFNPGTENPELAELLQEKGIKAEEACTLVLLSIGAY